jgi:hypothetical protein
VSFEEGSILEAIGRGAFAGCTSLQTVTIPASTRNIGDKAFYSCSSLRHVKFASGSNLTKIGLGAFCWCRSLETIIIPEDVSVIRTIAFASSGLREISIPDNVICIRTSAFADCKNLKEVRFSENSRLQRIDRDAFKRCKALTTIVIPQTVKSIGQGAFHGSGLKAIDNCPVCDADKMFTSQNLVGNGTSKDIQTGCRITFRDGRVVQLTVTSGFHANRRLFL